MENLSKALRKSLGIRGTGFGVSALDLDVDSAFFFASASLADALKVGMGAEEPKWF